MVVEVGVVTAGGPWRQMLRDTRGDDWLAVLSRVSEGHPGENETISGTGNSIYLLAAFSGAIQVLSKLIG